MSEQTITTAAVSLYQNARTTEEEIPGDMPSPLLQEIDSRHHDAVFHAVKPNPEESLRSLCEWHHRLRLRFAKDTQSENIFLRIGKYYDDNPNFSQLDDINNIHAVSWIDTDYFVYTCNEKSHHQFLKIGNIFLDKRTFHKYNLWIISKYNAEFSLSDDSDTHTENSSEAVNNGWSVPFLLKAIRKEMKKISNLPDTACQSRRFFASYDNADEMKKKVKKDPMVQEHKVKSITNHSHHTSTSKEKSSRGCNSMTITQKTDQRKENRQQAASDTLHKSHKLRRSDDNLDNMATDEPTPLLSTTKRRRRENDKTPTSTAKSSNIVKSRDTSVDMDIDSSYSPTAALSDDKQAIKTTEKTRTMTLASSPAAGKDDQYMDIDMEVNDLPVPPVAKEKRHKKTAEKTPSRTEKSSTGAKKEQRARKSKSDKHLNNETITHSIADKINETGQEKSDRNKVKKNQSTAQSRPRKTTTDNPSSAPSKELTEGRSKRTKIKRPNIVVHEIDPEHSLCWNMENYIINKLFNDSRYQLDCREMLQKFSKKAQRRRNRLCHLWKRYGRKFFEIHHPGEDNGIFHDTNAGAHPGCYVDISSDLLLNELDIKSDYAKR